MLAQRAERRRAIELGHDHVEEHERDRSLVLLPQRERFPTIRGDERREPDAFVDARNRVAHRLVVVDDQHVAAPHARLSRGPVRELRQLLGGRQEHAHRRAFARRGANLDRTAVRLDRAVHHRETEARALADRFRREERLEHRLLRRFVHARAGIGHRDLHVRQRGPLHDRGLDHDRPFAAHRIGGVAAQVEQHLAELRGIAVDDRHRPVDSLDGDALAQRPEERRHVIEHARERQWTPSIRTAAREREETARERRAALGFLLDAIEIDVAPSAHASACPPTASR